jgi:HEAT repeat protein
MTTDFDRFVASVHGGREWVDGFDLQALDRVVAPEERAQLVDLLIDRLRTPGDPRAIGALGALGTPSALVAVREALTSPNSALVAAAAHALAGIDPAAALSGAVHALRSSDSSARALAVQALRSLKGHEGEAALLGAIEDDEFNVRALATDGIFDLYRLRPPAVRGRRLDLLWMRLTSRSAAIRQAARADLSRLLDGLKRGHSPAELGLAVEPAEPSPAHARYAQSRRRDFEAAVDDYDLEALDELSGDERTGAEVSLLADLDGFDPRVPRALVHLRSEFAADALVERARELGRAPWVWSVLEPGSVAARALGQNGLFIAEVARALARLGRREQAEATLKLVAACPYPEVQDRARTALADLG